MNPSTPPTDPSAVSEGPEAIARLQRSVQRLSRLLVVTLLITVLLFFKVFETRSRKQEYILVDQDGTPRAVIGMRDDDTFLSMFDSAGKTRIAISSGGNAGPMLRLSNAGSTMHAMLTVQDNGAGLALLDDSGAGIQVFTDARDARINFMDPNGWLRLGLGTDDGMPFFGFMATNLSARIVMGSDENGGRLSFIDRHGKRRLSLGVHEDRPFLNPDPDPEKIGVSPSQ